MGQTLSQDEVDALLNAVADGTGDGDGGGDSGGGGAGIEGGGFNVDNFNLDEEESEVVPYDLTNQDRVIRGRMPTLEIIYERFVRNFRVSLSNSLRKMATLSIISTDLLKFGEFVNTLPIPSCMCVMRFASLRGPALMVFESKLAYAMVDSYFGGTDKPYTKIEGKEFTSIELMIMQRVMDMAIEDMEEAWIPVHECEIEYVRTEVNPQFVGLVPPTDVIISTTFEVELESASGTIAFVIPYATIEPIKQKLAANFQTEKDDQDKHWEKTFSQHLKSMFAELEVKLGEADITVGDLVNLSVGDVIPLDQEVSNELDLNIEGVSKYKCFFGTSKSNRAIQVTRKVED